MSLEEAVDLVYAVLKERNAKYGDSNLKDYGVLGLVVRMSDKLARIRNALVNEDLATIEDALIDIAGYAINGLRLLNEKDGLMGKYLSEYKLVERDVEEEED